MYSTQHSNKRYFISHVARGCEMNRVARSQRARRHLRSPFTASLRWQAWTVLLTNYNTHEFLSPPSVSPPLLPQRCITDRFRRRERVHPHLSSQENSARPSPVPTLTPLPPLPDHPIHPVALNFRLSKEVTPIVFGLPLKYVS